MQVNSPCGEQLPRNLLFIFKEISRNLVRRTPRKPLNVRVFRRPTMTDGFWGYCSPHGLFTCLHPLTPDWSIERNSGVLGVLDPIHILHRGFDSNALCRNHPKYTYRTSLSFKKNMFYPRCHVEWLNYPHSICLTRLCLVELAVTVETFTAGAKVKPSITATAELDRWTQSRHDVPLVKMRTSVHMDDNQYKSGLILECLWRPAGKRRPIGLWWVLQAG